MKTEIGDSFIDYVVRKAEQLWELPPEEAYFQENKWRRAITFKSIFSYEKPYPIKESILAMDPRRGSFLHGACLTEAQIGSILELVEYYQG